MYSGTRYSYQIIIKLEFFSTDFRNNKKKTAQISNFMKIRSVWAEFLHVDGRIDEADSSYSTILRTLLKTLIIFKFLN
jgi:hypothetical protein